MSAKTARANMNDIFRNDLDACPEIEDTLVYPGSLNDAWLMEYSAGARDIFFRMWMVQSFADPDVFKMALRVTDAVDQFAGDMAKLHYADTGDATYINPTVQRALKSRLLTALWPSWKLVVDEATGVCAEKAKRNLDRLVIGNGQWLER